MGLQDPIGSRGRPGGSQAVKRWVYWIPGGQGVGLQGPRDQEVGLQGPKELRGRPTGFQGLKREVWLVF